MDPSLFIRVSSPTWLLQLTGGDVRLLNDAVALLTVANHPANGSGALHVFEGMAACLEALHHNEQNEAAAQWARTARRLVALGHRLTGECAHINQPTSRERDRPIWGALLRLAAMARSDGGLHQGAAYLTGHVLLGQLRRTRGGNEELATFKPLSTKTAARLAACAQACMSGSRSDFASAWLKLAGVVPCTKVALLQLAGETQVGEVRRLAQAIARALEQQSRAELPCSQQPILIGGSQPTADKPAAAAGSTKSPRKERPGAAGLMKTASFACMAEAFGVYRYWHWLSPDELRPITRQLAAKLQGEGGQDDTADFALLALVSLVISHDHSCTLKLALKQNEDIWFCPILGCVFVDRGVLLGLTGPRGSHGYVLVVFPQLVVNAIRQRMRDRPAATELGELMQSTPDAAWLSAAEHFVSGLGDPSHPPRSARLSHSLAVAYHATGTPRVVAAQQTLNWCLGPDSAANYFGVSAQVANAAAARAFEWLELGPPQELPAQMWSGRPDVPTDDDMRGAWQLCGEYVQQAMELLPTCPTVAGCLNLYNPAMVACWRALPLADGGRPHRPDRPTLADSLVHPRWYRRDDKDLVERSGARLMLRSTEAADVLGAAIALRNLLIQRLRELGVPDDRLPRTLLDGKHSASLFVEVAPKTDRSGRLVARALSESLLEKQKAPWSGPANLGRVFWVSESVIAPEEFAEQLLSGHGRNLAHPGSVALSRPVMQLHEGCIPFTERVLQRLALPRFAGGLHELAPLQSPQLDLRFMDRRAVVKSRPKDIPTHHVDTDTLAALVVVDTCIAELGQAPRMPKAARALMAIICASGLMHSDDVAAAWETLSSAGVSPDLPWMEWRRVTGQGIRMPKQPQSWIATDLCGKLPPLAKAEAELRDWLIAQFPTVQWPTREGATVTALCYLVARWIRLHVPPFLVEAFRPELSAATFDNQSNARLCEGDPRCNLGVMDLPRPRQSLRQTSGSASDGLQQVMALLREHTPRNLKKGGYERRARRIGALLKGRFDLEQLSPVAAMVVCWLLREADRWKPRAPRRDAPTTWLEYLRRMLPILEKAERERRDPAQFTLTQWQQLGSEILNTDDVKDPEDWPRVHRERRHALARMVVLLAREPDYPDAMAALGTKVNAGQTPRYRPSRASALLTNFDVDTSAWLLQCMRDEWPLQSLQDEAQLRLALDGCARANETNALAMDDISTDGRQVAFWPHGFAHLKREWVHRTNELRPATTAVVLAAKAALRRLPTRPTFIFSQQGARIDLHLGREMQTRLTHMLRMITGNPLVVWHSLRGAGLMQRLAPGWELDVLQYLQGPLLLRHAQSLVDKLSGTTISHFAQALGCSGHLSHGVPIQHYLTAWPYWYSCAMRTALNKWRVSPELADAVPGANRALLSTANCRFSRDSVVDDWAWLVKQLHFQGWRKDRDPIKHLVVPSVKQAADDRPLPVPNQTRYLLLRTLHFDTVTAAYMARIAHGRALRLEPLGSLLRRFDEVHKPADGSQPSDVMRRSTARTLDKPIGRALFAAIVDAPEPVRAVLRQWLDGTGPMLNADRVGAVLRCLPDEVGLDFGWSPGTPQVDLTGGHQEPRIFSDTASKHAGAHPRVRLFRVRTSAPKTTTVSASRRQHNDHLAAVLTVLARLTSQIHPQPHTKGSTP